jgi:hypothetical protein
MQNRAEQLKVDITSLRSALLPEAAVGNENAAGLGTRRFGSGERKQERTDPLLMHNKRNEILHMLEDKHGVRLHRRSAAIYRSDDNKIGIVCTMSKWYSQNESYWYAYHPHNDEFLGAMEQGYFVLGMMDSDVAVALPVSVIRQNLSMLNTTTTADGRTYSHIRVTRSASGDLSLQRARGEPPLPLNPYIMQITG